jgi:hypothetical protein
MPSRDFGSIRSKKDLNRPLNDPEKDRGHHDQAGRPLDAVDEFLQAGCGIAGDEVVRDVHREVAQLDRLETDGIGSPGNLFRGRSSKLVSQHPAGRRHAQSRRNDHDDAFHADLLSMRLHL